MLVPATKADLDMILKWRNHPRVRQTHFHSAEISLEQHRDWWKTVLRGERKVFIFLLNGVPTGVLHFSHFDQGEMSAHWGFFLDLDGLEERGELLKAWMLLEREAIDYAFDELGLTWLRGETLTSNTVVRQLHRRFGFTECLEFTREVDGLIHTAVTTEMHVDVRPHHRV